jgi:hypothetical protein
MPETNATILIPDISGFTEFVTSTELEHSSHAINFLLEAIINAVEEEYEISEIEGDAVLMFKRGAAPSKKEVLDICLKIFNAFHYRRKWMQQHTVCPCGACQAIIDLTLKFVAHHGPVGEIKVGRFVKLSGKEVIVAHRLLKNSVPSNEYLLLTDELYRHQPDASEHFDLEWSELSDEFSSLGKLNYHFAKLENARKNSPDPPAPENNYPTDNISVLQMNIAANYLDAYMVMADIPGRVNWLPHLKKVEQDIPEVFVGSIHRCEFENFNAELSPMQMLISDEGILFAEKCRIEEKNISLIYQYVFKKIDEKNCSLSFRILNNGEMPIPEELRQMFFADMKLGAEKLKTVCESMEKSFF